MELESGPLLEQVLDATFPLWGDGLSRAAYGKWNAAQVMTRWGRDHLRRVGVVEGDQVVVSAKRYLLDITIDGQPATALGIGAVFTPEPFRGRGLAPRLIDAMVADAEARGCACAILFSEIGAPYYERLGFTVVPRVLVPVTVPRSRRGAPGTMVRALEPGDLPGLVEIAARHQAQSAGVSVARSAAQIEFGLTRRRLRAGLGPNGLRQLEVFVSEEGHAPVSFVVVSRGPEGVVLEDCGDRDPSGARVGAMLEALAERDPSVADRSLTAWFPAGMRPPQLSYGESYPAPEIMMVRPILPGRTFVVPPSRQPYWPSVEVF